MTGTGEGLVVRFAPTPAAHLVTAAAAGLTLLMAAASLAHLVFVLPAVLAALLTAQAAGPAVTVAGDTVTVVGPLRRRRLARADVAAVGVAPLGDSLGGGTTVVLARRTGDPVRVLRLWCWSRTDGAAAAARARGLAGGLAAALGLAPAPVPEFPPAAVAPPRRPRRTG